MHALVLVELQNDFLPGGSSGVALLRDGITKIFSKGTQADNDSYTGLYDNGHRPSPRMGEWLRDRGVTALTVGG